MAAQTIKVFAQMSDLILELYNTQNSSTSNELEEVIGSACEGSIDTTPSRKSSAPMLEPETTKAEMYVSSKHLTEVSSYFDISLNGGFCEGVTSGSNALRRIFLGDIDPTAFELLMQILHLKSNQLLDQPIAPEVLFQLCVLIDMCTINEQASLHIISWYKALSRPNSTCSEAKLDRWIFITYVLKKSDVFKTMTSLAQRSRIGSKHNPNAPTPSHIGGELPRLLLRHKTILTYTRKSCKPAVSKPLSIA